MSKDVDVSIEPITKMGVNLWVQSKNELTVADMISPTTTFFFDPLDISQSVKMWVKVLP
jgi:hypothetical protein